MKKRRIQLILRIFFIRAFNSFTLLFFFAKPIWALVPLPFSAAAIEANKAIAVACALTSGPGLLPKRTTGADDLKTRVNNQVRTRFFLLAKITNCFRVVPLWKFAGHVQHVHNRTMLTFVILHRIFKQNR